MRCERCGAAPVDALSAPTEDAPAPPRLLLDRYRVGPYLAGGGMGVVFEGLDVTLDRPVAIKFLGDAARGDPELVERFRREARALAAIEHPHIVPVYAVGDADGRPFIVMRRLFGRTLDHWIRDDGPLPADAAIRLGTQLCDALRRIHAAGFVHRDVKPANVMGDASGHWTLLDFGVMRTADDRLTRTGAMVGTPHFMSPEQGRGDAALDARSDLYALGATIYAAVTGTPPFDAGSAYELVHLHHTAPLVPASQRAQGVPHALDAVLARALAKRPADRWGSAAEMRAALEAAALAPSSPRSVAQTRRAAAALVAAGLAVGVAWFVTAMRPDTGPGHDSSGGPTAALAPVAALDTPPEFAPSARDVAPTSQERPPTPTTEAPDPPRDHAPRAAAPAASVAEVRGSPPGALRPLAVAPASSPPGAVAGPPASRPRGALTGPEAPAPESRIAGSPASVGVPAERAVLRVVTRAGGESTWAQIALDGAVIGTSPMHEVAVPPGRHRFTARREGFTEASAEVEVAAGERRKITLELVPVVR